LPFFFIFHTFVDQFVFPHGFLLPLLLLCELGFPFSFLPFFLPSCVFPSGFFMPFRPTFFPSLDLFFCHIFEKRNPSVPLESHSFWLASPL
jgi:hypothetical protein